MNVDTVDNSREVQRRRTPVKLHWISLALLIRATGVFAGEIMIPEAEAPTVIFATKLGSVDVDLSLMGSWTAGVSFGKGILLVPGLPPQILDSFPSMSPGLPFSQTPDITASLSLLNRYFLDVSVLGSFADNSIQLGYRGAPGEALQSVVLGTKEITIEPSRLLSIPKQAQGSLGASATLISGLSNNKLLLRWDTEARKSKTFVGQNELVEQEIPIDAYTRSRYFFLPDTAIDQGTLQVYLEDPAGTVQVAEGAGIRRYRLAGFDDVVLDSVLGLVSLRSPAKGRVLVYYRKQGAGVGTAAGLPGLPDDGTGPDYKRNPAVSKTFNWIMQYFGQPMSSRKVTLPVGDCLLLWEPGDSSPFDIGSSYEFASEPPADQSRIAFRFVAKDTAAVLPAGLRFRSMPEEKRFMVLRDPDLGSTAYRFWNFFPFDDPTAGLLYGPKRDSISGALGFSIVAQFLSPVDGLILEPEVIPGSVQVRVNGVPETRFEVDSVSGKLTLLLPLLPTDRVEVSYLKAQQGLSGGDILFAWVDRIPLSDAARIVLSAGVRWNADPWSVSQEAYSKSGTVIVTAGIEGTAGPFTYDAQAGAAYNDPDTSGILRLFGMEAGSLAIDTAEDNAVPASAPDPAEDPGLAGINQGNRGQLLYRDYRLYGALGSVTLQPLGTIPVPPALPYQTGSRMGPYNVAGSDGNLAGQSLVMEYSLEAGQWGGAQLAISAGADADLSTARSLTIRFRGLDLTGTAAVFVQLGAISEDLDGTGALTGTLKSESSSSDTGYPFLDAATSAVLRVGAGPRLQGNSKLDSEDRNANGILDFEDKDRLVTFGPLAPGAGWATFTYSFTDTERQKLLAARSVRIVIKESSSIAPATGKLVIDAISVDTTPFWPQTAAADRPIVEVRQTGEGLARVPPPAGRSLDQVFADTYRRFHPNGEANQVLETSWTGATTTGFSVRGYIALGTGGIRYRTIMVYVRSPSGSSTYSFSLLDAAGKGIRWSAAILGDNEWHEMRVSEADASVRIDGVALPGAPSFDGAYGSLSFLQVDLPVRSGAGSLYIDEAHCTDPLGSFGAALVGTISARFPGTLVAVAGVPLLADLVIREDLSLISTGFAPLYGTPSTAEDLSSRTELSANVLFTRLAANLQLRQAAGAPQVAGGHRITLPSGGTPVSITDAFSVDWTGGFTREDSLSVSLGQALSAALVGRADAALATGTADGQLNQSWQLTAGSGALAPITLATEVGLSQSLLGYPLVADWYGGRWVREATLLLPWDGGVDLVRRQGLNVTIGMPASPIGFEAGAEARSEGAFYTAAGSRQTATGSLSLKLTFNLGPREAPDGSVGFSYTRVAVLTTTLLPGPRFEAESAELARVLSLQPYLLTSIPFVEIFTDLSGGVLPGWQSAAAAQAVYAPALSASLQRSYGARLLDLVVPSAIEVSLGQDFKKAGDLTQAAAFIRPKISTRAVNLFGSLGAYPLFPLFRTDEYSASVSASLEGSPGTALRLSSMGVDAFATLMGDQETSLTFVESFNRKEGTAISLGNDTQVLVDWAVHPVGGIVLPLVPTDIGKTGKLLHRERAQLTVAWQDSGSFHPFTLVLGHATTLAYEGHGTVKGSIDIGMDAEYLGALGLAWRVAIRAALEAKLTF